MAAGQVLSQKAADVVRKAIEKTQAQVVPPDQEVVIGKEEAMELDRWSRVPNFTDQYSNPAHRATWKMLPPQAILFDLEKPDDLSAYNRLLARAEPASAPQVIMNEKWISGVTATGAVVKVLVRFHELLYYNPNKPILDEVKNHASDPK